ncbi:MAG: amidase [Gammaproteobacteria bacterium]|nr:amidase [Gammaproteobacteria bacterium]
MSYQSPDATDIRCLAGELGLEMSEPEAQRYLGWLQPFAAGYAALDGLPSGLPAPRYPERRWWRADDRDNPLGAWAVRTALTGRPGGRLAGRTIAVKDNILVAGVPLANGTAFLADCLPEFDATVVDRLLDAGGSIAGKSVCEYLCVSGGSATSASGPVHNPHRRGYAAGGSSSGSAALVAAGAVDLALGCDQGGSIRIPASWSGTCGMKPTHGLVPYTGIMGMEEAIDHVGPITANVADSALMLEVLAGPDGHDGRQRAVVVQPYTAALGQPIADLRIGVVREGFSHPLGDAVVDDCVQAAAARLAALGATVMPVSIPRHLQGPAIWGALVGDGLWATLRLRGIGMNMAGPTSPQVHAAMQGAFDRAAEAPVNIKLVMLLGRWLERYRGAYYGRARNLIPWLRAGYDQALAQVDLLLLPTTVTRARPHPRAGTPAGDDETLWQAFNCVLNTCQFDATGHPAMSIPCGLRDGLPVGMMLVGRYFDEPTIYRAAHAFEQAGDWRAP